MWHVGSFSLQEFAPQVSSGRARCRWDCLVRLPKVGYSVDIMNAFSQNSQVALIQFPGSNCESETVRALEAAGLSVATVRWNESPDRLEAFEAYVIGGGFSYEDRIRAGVIAAKEPLLETMCRRASEGAPVLGICNGAQILLETGLIPGFHPGEVQMALAPNRMAVGDTIVRRGHNCVWVELRYEAKVGRTPFTAELQTGDHVPMTISHSEGRFVCKSEETLRRLEENDQVVYRYVGPTGEPSEFFPDNPNGSWSSVAGLCNPEGNVVALMPHPERASFLHQVPSHWPGPWGDRKRDASGAWEAFSGAGPGLTMFRSLAARLGAQV